MEEVKEREFYGRYLNPILYGLFDNPDEGIFFLGGTYDQINLENRESSLISKRRPDSCITRLRGVQWKNTIGVDEADNLYAICKDLHRLGVLSKNTVDFGKVRGILTYQAIGRSITFYMTTLLKNGFYIMVKLAHLAVPECLEDMPRYLMDFDKLSLVLNGFDKWCQSLDPDEAEQQQQRPHPTMSTPTFCRIISSTTSRARDSVMKAYYN
ncbi:hypothetical protein BC941DRAFT_357062 [Chlamydoabsidia padenii]|nr:hypothetical protein BC941DRAFT_357062 [Chlamydoabsidia padenii]